MGRFNRGRKDGRHGGGGRGYSSRGGFKQTENLRNSAFDRQNGGGDATALGHFSMADEARNTEYHRAALGSPLRNMAINFVAAGKLDPIELLKPTVADKKVEKEEQGSSEEDAALPDDLPSGAGSPAAKSVSNSEEFTANIDVGKIDLGADVTVPAAEVTMEEPARFVLDLIGDEDLAPTIKNPAIRPPSPSPSVSSSASEKIVFVPRGKRGASPARRAPPHTMRTSRTSSLPKQVKAKRLADPNPEFPVQVKTTTFTAAITSVPLPRPQKEPIKSEEADFLPLNGQSRWNGKRATPGNRRRRGHGRSRKTVDQDAIEDYMENIAAQIRAEATENGEPSMLGGRGILRDLGGDDEWVDESSTDEEDAASDSDAVRRYKNGWEGEELEDFDDISTDEEGPKGLISTVLRSRTRPSGLQYLIRWDGYEADDATWALATALDSSADAKIKQFEEDVANRVTQMFSGDDLDSSDLEDEEGGGDDEDEEVDEDEDFKLAQLLQRQEELGLLSVEQDLNDDFLSMGVGKRKGKSRRNIPDITPDPSTGAFPSASRMAAAYDDFDVMDWARPSVAAKRKGKGKMVEINISDSELEAQINNSWRHDREKKKLRKIRREEMRAQGLLGVKAKKTGKADLSEKYREGMAMSQVFGEIRSFMMSAHNNLALPPMKKRDRKLVHDLAAKLNLKSKSIGGGKSRFTTIFKTKHSSLYECDEEGIDSVMQHPGFLKRMDVTTRSRPQRANGGAISKKFRKEGQIVGAGASELSADNKGRLMLEKMGYKTGMSLGADNNKGIAEPIVAVIRVNKAGLG